MGYALLLCLHFEYADSFYVFFFFSFPPSCLCLQIGERIRVILDMEDKTLAFERGYEFLGVAFRGLPKVCLYPAVSAVYGNTEVTLVYLGKPLDGWCGLFRWDIKMWMIGRRNLHVGWRETCIKGKTKKCGCVSKNHRGNRTEFWNGGPAILQELCYISSFYQARKILRVAVGWVGSWHMHVATDFIAKMAVCDLNYLRKDLIQNCLRKLTWDL